MSTVSSITSQAAAGYIQKTTSSNSTSSSAAAAQEEATETLQATKQEAAKGDRVAINKLARVLQTQQLQNSAPAQEPGKGELTDQKA